MKPNKVGQITKFHTPLADEDPNQFYVVLKINEDDQRSRVDIKPLNTNLSFPPINTVGLDDLVVVEVNTSDLIGQIVKINKSDSTQTKGKVIKVKDQKLILDLIKSVDEVETNVWLTIIDENGKEQIGTLFVN